MKKTAILAVVAAFAIACASASPEGQQVRFATSPDDVFGCVEKGLVSAKAMMSIDESRNSVRNKAAAMGANVIRIDREVPSLSIIEGTAFDCNTAAVRERDEALLAAANQTITCTAGTDCEYKWSRAMEWVQNNSAWKFRTVTDTLLTTEGPNDTVKPAFEIARLSQGDGKNYRITMRAWCGAGNCEELITQLRANFNRFVMVPPAQ
jgi:hypothetical protein